MTVESTTLSAPYLTHLLCGHVPLIEMRIFKVCLLQLFQPQNRYVQTLDSFLGTHFKYVKDIAFSVKILSHTIVRLHTFLLWTQLIKYTLPLFPRQLFYESEYMTHFGEYFVGGWSILSITYRSADFISARCDISGVPEQYIRRHSCEVSPYLFILHFNIYHWNNEDKVSCCTFSAAGCSTTHW